MTFPSDHSAYVDGTKVASPYTLTQNCTIRVYSKGTDYGVAINDQVYGTSETISLSQVDITVGGQIVPSMGGEQVIVTINYTA